MKPKQSHPLDGHVLVFKYTEADYEDEGSALAFYQLTKKKLETIWSPGGFFEPSQLGDGVLHEGDIVSVDELALRCLRKRKIDAVTSVFYDKDFFGIPKNWVDLSGGKRKTTECWCEYESLCFDEPKCEFLVDNGITVRFYDEVRRMFLPKVMEPSTRRP
ncbi:MAG: hypothetical protein AABY13_02960 [Nanoarchaeota archaeon]